MSKNVDLHKFIMITFIQLMRKYKAEIRLLYVMAHRTYFFLHPSTYPPIRAWTHPILTEDLLWIRQALHSALSLRRNKLGSVPWRSLDQMMVTSSGKMIKQLKFYCGRVLKPVSGSFRKCFQEEVIVSINVWRMNRLKGWTPCLGLGVGKRGRGISSRRNSVF